MKTLFATSLVSPFQLELATAMNSLGYVDYHVAFTLPYREARGQHWQIDVPVALRNRVCLAEPGMDSAGTERWLLDRLHEQRPDCVVSGALWGPISAAARMYARTSGCKLGYWLEPLNYLRLAPRRWLARLVARRVLGQAHFVLAIGDRAEQDYREMCPRTALVPYGEDLGPCLSLESHTHSKEPLTFLYSGQLVARQNLGALMAAAVALVRSGRTDFKLIIAGKGPERSLIDRALRDEPLLRAIVRYDSDYSTWNDRLRPFGLSDVLLYPSLHSGWGLVVPEAMAAGLVVITTRRVEAARYFLRHRVSGIVIEPNACALRREMEWCMDHRDEVKAMGIRARADAMDGHAPVVAASMTRVLLEQVGTR